MANEVTSHSHMSVCWINRILMRTSAEYSATVLLTDGNNLFFSNCHLYNFVTGVKSSLVYISILLLPVIFLRLNYSIPSLFTIFRVRNWRAHVLTSELAIVGGSSHPCLCVLEGIGVSPPFSQAAQINLWNMMDREECYTLLPWSTQQPVLILNPHCQTAGACCLPPP